MSDEKRENERIESVGTGGGAYVRGDVSTGGGDFVGRDKVIEGDEVHGDKITQIGQAHIVHTGTGDIIVAGESVRDKELAYLDGLLTRYDYWLDHYTPLAGIAEVRAAVRDGPRLDLPMPFIPPGFEKLTEHGFGGRAEVRREPVGDIRDTIAQNKRIILLGDPGAGKTTTLWRLAYDYATTARDDARAPLPVLVPLGGYTDDGPFDAYLARHLGPLADYLDTYRASGRLVLLLDGLNEMPQARYRERVARIREVLDRYPDGIAVVTCRALDYVEKLERLQKVKLSPLDEGRIRTFLHNYLGETAGERLFQAMHGDKERPLLELSRNPYMLLMTAQVYAGEGELPANRARLFGAFVDALLGREEKRHPAEWIDAKRQKDGLAALAYAMQEERGRGTAVEREWAVGQLCQAVPDCDAERLLYLATSASLLDADDATVRFYHQLLQEYFAAHYVVGHAPQHALTRVLSRCTKDRWREVILLIAGLLADADDFFARFRRAIDELIADDSTLVSFIRWAAEKATTVQTSDKSVAVRRSYCALALALDLDRDLARGLNRDLARNLGRDLDRDLVLARDLDLILAFALALVFALVHDRTLDLASNLILVRAFGRSLVSARDHVSDLDTVLKRARDFAPDLYQALSTLQRPGVLDPREAWQTFAGRLQTIVIEHCNIGHDWNLSKEQARRLVNYFKANRLLLECLDVANVSDRAAIEDSLLLPPGGSDAQEVQGDE